MVNSGSRIIKFRAWSKELNQMFYGDSGFEFDGDGCVYLNVIQTTFGAGESDPIIMQYTGLKDPDGKEIYEDDILGVAGPEEINSKYVVVFHEGCFCKQSTSEEGEIYKTLFDDFDKQWLEVVGNIHENPELLERR